MTSAQCALPDHTIDAFRCRLGPRKPRQSSQNTQNSNPETENIVQTSLKLGHARLETFPQLSQHCLDSDRDATSCRAHQYMKLVADEGQTVWDVKSQRSSLHRLFSVRFFYRWLVCIRRDAQQIVVFGFADGRSTQHMQEEQGTQRERCASKTLSSHRCRFPHKRQRRQHFHAKTEARLDRVVSPTTRSAQRCH